MQRGIIYEKCFICRVAGDATKKWHACRALDCSRRIDFQCCLYCKGGLCMHCGNAAAGADAAVQFCPKPKAHSKKVSIVIFIFKRNLFTKNQNI